MFVGEVRCATTGTGSSWKLSGGRKFSWAVTNVSKNRHVRRESARRARTCSGESISWSEGRGGRLIQCATAGAAIHRAMKGKTAYKAWGRTSHTVMKAAKANITPSAMRLKTL